MQPDIKLVIVAALEREIASLVRNWARCEKQFEGRRFLFFESQEVAAVCGGIGVESARRAAQAAVSLYRAESLCSAGFAGALDDALRAGSVISPSRVVDASDGSHFENRKGEGILVTFAEVAGAKQKAKLRQAFGAQLVDMEAAAVAKAAEARGVQFFAIKAISDTSDFDLPQLDQFFSRDGRFRSAEFAFFILPRPWLWPKILKLRRDSIVAAEALCRRLRQVCNQLHLDDAGIEAQAVLNHR